MKKAFSFLLAVSFLGNFLFAQCPVSNLTITTQTEIDNFATTYPGCTAMSVGITIQDDNNDVDNITNLDGLSHIVSFNTGKYFFILDNNNLTTLAGLSSLVSVGHEFFIHDNPLLTDIDLPSFTTANDVFSLHDNGITSLDGLSGLTSVGDDLRITNNSSLLNLDGLSNVATVGDDLSLTSNSNLGLCCGIHTLVNGGINDVIHMAGNTGNCNNNGTDVLAECGAPVPTMGEWALMIFALIIMSMGVVTVMRWQREKQIQVSN